MTTTVVDIVDRLNVESLPGWADETAQTMREGAEEIMRLRSERFALRTLLMQLRVNYFVAGGEMTSREAATKIDAALKTSYK